MARSLTPRTASDLKTVIPFEQCRQIIAEHGLDYSEFSEEVLQGKDWRTRTGATLQEIRDWLGY